VRRRDIRKARRESVAADFLAAEIGPEETLEQIFAEIESREGQQKTPPAEASGVVFSVENGG